MKETVVLQTINTALLLMTIPFSLSLIYQLVLNTPNHKRDFIRMILIVIFTAISISAILSIHLIYQILVGSKNPNDLIFEANVRNLVKNFSFFITSTGFWYIEIKRGRG